MTSNKNQHYVPQFYIKGFETENKIYVFDIVHMNEFMTITRNIGSENYYHNIDKKIINAFYKSDREDFVDSVINDSIEKYYSGFINIISEISSILGGLNKDLTVQFDERIIENIIDYMIVQYIRTKKFRKFFEPIGELTNDIIKKYNIPIEISIDEFTRIAHLNMLYKVLCYLGYADLIEFKVDSPKLNNMQIKFIKSIKSKMLNYGKTYLINKSSKTFFTSDAPVIIEWIGDKKDDFSLSYFPINKNFSILFHDDNMIPSAKRFDDSVLIITDDKIDILDNLNLYVVKSAERFVYNGIADFEKLPSFINGDFKSMLALY